MSVQDAIRNAPNVGQPLPGITTCGQPALEDLTAARDAGARVVIDLRDPMEARPFDEAAEVAALGMTYRNIPVVPGALTTEMLDQILGALREHANEPVILHCASANRVGGALLPHLMLDHGLSEPEAVEAAMRAGLRSAELMEWGLDYVRQQG